MNRQNASTVRRPAPKPSGKLVESQQEETLQHGGPIDRISMFPISASIWMKYGQDGNPAYSISFQRTYKDANDKWVYSDNFFQNDLLLLAEAAKEAYHRIRLLRDADRNGHERTA